MNNYRQNERGSAVILALALLSLMLILIMSFVTNALIESRVSETKSYQLQTKNITDVALNRALISLKYYVDPEGTPSRFNNFVSWEDDPDVSNDFPNATEDGYAEALDEIESGNIDEEKVQYYVGIKKAMDTALSQTLKDKDILLYRYPTNRNIADTAVENWVAANDRSFIEQPRWQYFTSPDGSDTPIVGRFAFAVLPDKGQVNINSIVEAIPDVERTGDYTNEFQFNQMTINEYNEDDGTAAYFKTFADLSGRNWDLFSIERAHTGDSVIKEDGHLEDVETYVVKNGDNISNFIDFEVTDNANQKYYAHAVVNALYQKFLFNQKLSPSDGEIYYIKGDADEKDRFLLRDYPYSAVSGTTDDTRITEIKAVLPFLNNIGDSAENFVSLDARRNQIAANLLDLGDTDNIPASDAAHPWTEDSTPTYTGNEKTPYLSAMALNMTADADDEKLQCDFTSQLELANLYGDTASDYSLKLKYSDFNFSTKLHPDTTIKAYVKMKVRAKIKIQIGRFEREQEMNLPTSITQSFEFKLRDVGIEPELVFAETDVFPNEWLNLACNDRISKFEKKVTKTFNYEGADGILQKIFTNNKAQIEAYVKEYFKNKPITIDLSNIGINLSSNNITVVSVSSIDEFPKEYMNQNRRIVDLKGFSNLTGDFTKCVMLLKKASGGIDFAYITNDNAIDEIKNAGKYSFGEDTENNYTNMRLFALISDDPRVNLNAKDWKFENTLQDLGSNLPPAVKTFSTEELEKLDEQINAVDLLDAFNTPDNFKYSTLAGVSRGKAWETINLLNANDDSNSDKLNRGEFEDFVWVAGNRTGDVGTTIDEGDGGILNQISLNDNAHLKINIATTSKDIWRGLLYGIKYDSNGDGIIDDSDAERDDDDLTKLVDGIVAKIKADPTILQTRSDLVELLNSVDEDASIDVSLSAAEKYEILDKVIHLVKVEQYPEEFQILVVAQTIKDVGGNDGNGIALTKYHKCPKANDEVELEIANAQIGKFDFVKCSNYNNCGEIYYFDEILGEEKILVTVRRVGNKFKVIKKEKMPL